MLDVKIFIELTKDKITVIDFKDYATIKDYKWHSNFQTNKFYARTNVRKSGGGYKGLLLHRFIMQCPTNMDIDHIDGNPLNNCRDNLRVCTRAENARNRGKTKANTSGYKGISFMKDRGSWSSKIRVDYKDYHLGFFPTKEEAYGAYCNALNKFHGEFKNKG